MPQIVSGNGNENAPDHGIKDEKPDTGVSGKRHPINPPEGEGRRNLDQRILPRHPRAAGVALATLGNEARERNEFIPAQRLAAGEALRPPAQTVTRPMPVNRHIQEAPDNETEEENE